MGQNPSSQSYPRIFTTPQPAPPSKPPVFQLEILTEKSFIKIDIPEPSLTCGWLLSETIRSYKCSKSIVALKTIENLDIIDDWLVRFDKSLKPFKSISRLTAVFAEPSSLVELENFNIIKLIGIGENSQVLLSRKKDTGMLYAIKAVQKSLISEADQLDQILTQRNVLTHLSSIFINKLYYAYQSDKQFCFVSNFCSGGELKFHLKNLVRLTENQARFYFCEMVAAIEYLHGKKIVYNNLKLENVMIDTDGHVKLVGFGKVLLGKPDSLGICSIHKEKLSDFKDLGSVLFEILTSVKPSIQTTEELNNSFPKYLSNNAKNLITSLVFSESNFSIEKIKHHEWCQNVKWEKVYKRKTIPPFKPNLKQSNFEKTLEGLEIFYCERPGHYISGFDYAGSGLDRSFANIAEMSHESNVTEKNSIDTEDTFNFVSASRSLELSQNIDEEEISAAFVIQPHESDGKKFRINISLYERSVRLSHYF